MPVSCSVLPGIASNHVFSHDISGHSMLHDVCGMKHCKLPNSPCVQPVHLCACVCVCVCARAHACVHMCMHVLGKQGAKGLWTLEMLSLCMQWTCVESHARAWRTVAQGHLPACRHSPAWSDGIPTTCQGAQGDQVQSATQEGLQPSKCPGREEQRAQPCKGPGSEEEQWDFQSGQDQQCHSGRVHQGEQMPKKLRWSLHWSPSQFFEKFEDQLLIV